MNITTAAALFDHFADPTRQEAQTSLFLDSFAGILVHPPEVQGHAIEDVGYGVSDYDTVRLSVWFGEQIVDMLLSTNTEVGWSETTPS